LSHNFKHILV